MSGLQVLPLLCQVALAVVFVVSGVAKALDPAGTRQALLDFRVPSGLVPLMVLGLPAAELGTAALLVLPPTGRAGGLAAVALLLGFSAVVVSALRSGRAPQCRCFGSLSAARVSGWTLRRNGALLVLGVGASSGSRDGSLVHQVSAAAGGLLLAGGLLWWERYRESGLTEQDEAPAPAGRQHGGFSLRRTDGEQVHSDELLAHGLPELLVFLSPGCSSCTMLLPEVEAWIDRHHERVVVHIVVSGAPEQAERLQQYVSRPLPVLLEDDWDVRRALGTLASPGGALLLQDGTVAKTAGGASALRRLLGEALSGASAPVDETPTVDGVPAASVGLEDAPGPHALVDTHDLDGRGQGLVIVDRRSGASAELDRSSALVWRCLDGTSSLADIVHDLVEVFGVPQDQVSKDVLELVQSLGEGGFLAGVLPSWADGDDTAATAAGASASAGRQ